MKVGVAFLQNPTLFGASHYPATSKPLNSKPFKLCCSSAKLSFYCIQLNLGNLAQNKLILPIFFKLVVLERIRLLYSSHLDTIVIDAHEFVWNVDITLIGEFCITKPKHKIVSVLYQIVILQ